MSKNRPVDRDATIDLTMEELRAITAFAVACARPALAIFEHHCPDDPRPREALDEADRFAAGGERNQALRVRALAAHRAARAAQENGRKAAAAAARAAGHAAASAYLHPLAQPSQVIHILGSAVHAARAFELDAGDDRAVGTAYVEEAVDMAGPLISDVLRRYPLAPISSRRVGELLTEIDTSLRRLRP